MDNIKIEISDDPKVEEGYKLVKVTSPELHERWYCATAARYIENDTLDCIKEVIRALTHVKNIVALRREEQNDTTAADATPPQ